MNHKPPYQAAYEQIGKDTTAFAKMVADFPRMGSGEFLKHYPDYSYDGTDYVCRRAEELASKLSAYAAEFGSHGRRAVRAA